MQFKVPQFLDIEDKIFGPFTFRQFVYLAGGAGMCYILFQLMGFWGLIPMAIVAALSLALAFYRPNNKPFVNMLESWFKYFMQSKLYIWKKDKKVEPEQKAKIAETVLPVAPSKKLDGSRLRDLAWSLDVLDLKKE